MHCGRREAIPAGVVGDDESGCQSQDARLPMPGSLIAKKYKDRTLVVKVSTMASNTRVGDSPRSA